MFSILDQTVDCFVVNEDGNTMLFDTASDAEKFANEHINEYIILEVC